MSLLTTPPLKLLIPKSGSGGVYVTSVLSPFVLLQCTTRSCVSNSLLWLYDVQTTCINTAATETKFILRPVLLMNHQNL